MVFPEDRQSGGRELVQYKIPHSVLQPEIFLNVMSQNPAGCSLAAHWLEWIRHNHSNEQQGKERINHGLTPRHYFFLNAISSAEYSLYIHHEHRKRGLGRMLLRDLLVEAKARNFHAVIGKKTDNTCPTIRMLPWQ
jgi:GNAT superfamily N-acetyltransferase